MVSCSVSACIKTRSEVSVSSPSVLAGNVVTLSVKVWTGTDVFVDPDTMTLTIKPPDDVASDVNVIFPGKTSDGHYSHDFDTDGQPAGIYRFRWRGDGTNDIAAEGSFEVLASQL